MVEIRQKLNVATVLEGSVRRSGDQIRITTQLINAADGYHLWSETYDRKLTRPAHAGVPDLARSHRNVTLAGQRPFH